MKEWTLIIAAFISGLITGLLVFMPVGISQGHAAQRHEAVRAGYAEYFLDEGHQRQWRWLPAPPKGEAK